MFIPPFLVSYTIIMTEHSFFIREILEHTFFREAIDFLRIFTIIIFVV
jgi:hypothetical protein